MPRCSATVRCHVCSWAAQHRADDPKEIADFLERTRRSHYADAHPGTICDVTEHVGVEKEGA